MMELSHLVVIDGHQSHAPQPFALHSVVHNVTQTIERLALAQFFLGFLDGGGHPETEAAAIVYFDLEHNWSK
jgi:hypothetical protein